MKGKTDSIKIASDDHKRFFLVNLPNPIKLVDLIVGQEWRLTGNHAHQTLFCLHGIVWVTQERDIHDYILEKGDAFVVTLPGLVLVRAFSQARIGYAKSLLPHPFIGSFSQTVFK